MKDIQSPKPDDTELSVLTTGAHVIDMTMYSGFSNWIQEDRLLAYVTIENGVITITDPYICSDTDFVVNLVTESPGLLESENMD